MTPPATLVAEYQAGASIQALAARHHHSQRTVAKILRSQGLAIRRGPAPLDARLPPACPDAVLDELRRHPDGIEAVAIAATLGTSTASVACVLDQLRRQGLATAQMRRVSEGALWMPISARPCQGSGGQGKSYAADPESRWRALAEAGVALA